MVTVSFDLPDEWVEEAAARNLENAVYIRRMVRAGRRQFGMDYKPVEVPAEPNTLKLEENSGSNVDEQLKNWIQTNLSTDEAQDIDDLVGLLENDFQGLMADLLEEDKAKYRPDQGGYLKITGDE